MKEHRTEHSETDYSGDESISSGRLLLLSVVSAFLYISVALGIFYFWRDESFGQIFASGFSLPVQLLVGVIAGGAAAAVIIFIMQRPPVSDVLSDFYIIRVLSQSNFSLTDHLHLSFFAGAGEEILFRGAIQPLLGNTVTSIIFVGIHGYFRFTSLGHWLFGVMMFGLSFFLGVIFSEAGLIAAMTAHAVYDVIMLQVVQRMKLV
ncbi:CPBP family intramembrane glutamic endopeptidase [Gracilimonas mengyeensis]|uniref:CAAX prenyl protease 2/Lysostaphin resistance protein A-like domain-containing protein n=1 Tax=Gracilimonas mengyeensis TaxID=1302730 RepID=A0A521CPE1_9BACT|nr:CPBP family intramembrane glutamic endopeptidase [Gracilimonas mengyeensis]SMO61255.1 hypothetical protein SAMN06265219_10642 [Gracilimonas mengyeensis]